MSYKLEVAHMNRIKRTYLFFVTLMILIVPQMAFAGGGMPAWHAKLCAWLLKLGVPECFIVYLHILFGWA
jgi:hypothetical protein